MPYNLSTRTVGAPAGTSGRFAPTRKPMSMVPLSVFFLDAERERAADQNGDEMLYGLRKGKQQQPGEPAEKKTRGRRKKRQPTKRSRVRSGRETKITGEIAGGNAKAVDQAAAGGDGQSTASQTPQESVTMATGTPLISPGVSTRAASWPGGASKLGNVAQYPVPIGKPLRRTSGNKKKSRRKKKQESRADWIQRLGQMMQS